MVTIDTNYINVGHWEDGSFVTDCVICCDGSVCDVETGDVLQIGVFVYHDDGSPYEGCGITLRLISYVPGEIYRDIHLWEENDGTTDENGWYGGYYQLTSDDIGFLQQGASGEGCSIQLYGGGAYGDEYAVNPIAPTTPSPTTPPPTTPPPTTPPPTTPPPTTPPPTTPPPGKKHITVKVQDQHGNPLNGAYVDTDVPRWTGFDEKPCSDENFDLIKGTCTTEEWQGDGDNFVTNEEGIVEFEAPDDWDTIKVRVGKPGFYNEDDNEDWSEFYEFTKSGEHTFTLYTLYYFEVTVTDQNENPIKDALIDIDALNKRIIIPFTTVEEEVACNAPKVYIYKGKCSATSFRGDADNIATDKDGIAIFALPDPYEYTSSTTTTPIGYRLRVGKPNFKNADEEEDWTDFSKYEHEDKGGDFSPSFTLYSKFPGPPQVPCVIMCVASGTELIDCLQPLRNFRDLILKKHKLGKAFIAFYYNTLSKKLSPFLTKHENLKKILRIPLKATILLFQKVFIHERHLKKW